MVIKSGQVQRVISTMKKLKRRRRRRSRRDRVSRGRGGRGKPTSEGWAGRSPLRKWYLPYMIRRSEERVSQGE